MNKRELEETNTELARLGIDPLPPSVAEADAPPAPPPIAAPPIAAPPVESTRHSYEPDRYASTARAPAPVEWQQNGLQGLPSGTTVPGGARPEEFYANLLRRPASPAFSGELSAALEQASSPEEVMRIVQEARDQGVHIDPPHR